MHYCWGYHKLSPKTALTIMSNPILIMYIFYAQWISWRNTMKNISAIFMKKAKHCKTEHFCLFLWLHKLLFWNRNRRWRLCGRSYRWDHQKITQVKKRQKTSKINGLLPLSFSISVKDGIIDRFKNYIALLVTFLLLFLLLHLYFFPTIGLSKIYHVFLIIFFCCVA